MLKPLIFTPYTTSEISPTGWLYKQLRIQADGLSGNLDKIWPDIRDSKWVGGDKEGWERVPYWLDGFIPLAWLLDDGDMKNRAKTFIEAILDRQKEDGWICPCTDEERANYDIWALFLICKVLVLYHDCTGDERIEDAVYRALKYQDRHMEGNTLFDWGATRWYECLIPLFWLYERRPESWMEDLALKLYAEGTDYEKVFEHWRFSQPYEHGRWSQLTHVVNMAMCLKSKALISRLIGGDPNNFAKKAIRTLLRDHGMAAEHFTGDECLSGTSPTQGSECCSVTEAMYSYEWLLAVTGDSEWSDRLEKAAFNTLPATISPDMWTHQYDQMTNQVQCSRFPEGHVPFRTNSNEAHLFGLEPNFGCCTANFNQGWPKFALSTFMAADGGIAVTAIAPSVLETVIGGVKVSVKIATNYPFEDGYSLSVTTDTPVKFPLYVRIPGDAVGAMVGGTGAKPGFFLLEKEWSGTEAVQVAFSFETKLSQRPNDMVCIWRGPLLYSVAIQERWEKLEFTRDGVERKYPYCDYEIYPESPWNYGLCSNAFELSFNGIGKYPFSPQEPPVSMSAEMAEIDWPLENGRCTEQPAGRKPLSPPRKVTLIPYGCTNLRLTEMPYLNE